MIILPELFLQGRRAVQTLVRHANDHYFFYKPFLMMVSLPAPHSPWDTDPKYADVYKDLKAPRTDHFNVLGKVCLISLLSWGKWYFMYKLKVHAENTKRYYVHYTTQPLCGIGTIIFQ